MIDLYQNAKITKKRDPQQPKGYLNLLVDFRFFISPISFDKKTICLVVSLSGIALRL